MMRHSIWFVVAGLLVVASMCPAYAQTVEKPVPLVVEGRAGRIHIYVNPQKPTILQFTSPIRGVDRVVWNNFLFRRDPGDVLILHPDILKRGVWGSFRVGTPNYEVTIVVHATDDPEKATDIAEIRHRTELEAIEEMIKARVVLREAEARREEQATCDIELTKRDEQIHALEQAQGRISFHATSSDHRVLTEVMDGSHARIPVDRNPEAAPERGIVIRSVAWEKFATMRVLTYEIANYEPIAYRAADVRVYNQFGTKNHAGAAMIGKDREQHGLLAVIQPGEQIRAAVLVNDTDQLGKHVTLMLSEPNDERPVMREEIPVWDFTPPPDENEGKRTLYVKGLLGAIQLDDMDDSTPGGRKTAFLSGYGARLTYGFTKHVNVETELVYAKSGTVSFGAIGRSDSLMRLQFGGLLRFGDTFMPTLRLGVGLYGASQRRMMGGVTDSEMDFDLSWTGGVGIDIRLSDAWVLGGALSLDSAMNSGSRSLEFGLHLGYEWTPEGKP